MANITKCGGHHHLDHPSNVSNYFPFIYIKDKESSIFSAFTVLICIIGLVGNGTVFWFLCSNMRRHSPMFIRHLSAADFGVLLSLSMNIVLFFTVEQHGQANYAIYITHLCLSNIYAWMHYASAHFLMAISMDRCMAILFPVWYRCYLSTSLLAATSIFLWALSFLTVALSFYFYFCYEDLTSNIVTFTIIYFLVALSTGVLSLKVCSNSHLRRRGNLLVGILISLVFFLITMVPRGFFTKKSHAPMSSFLLFLKSINSSVNPIIYFFVGMLKVGSAKRSWKSSFRNLFKEDDTGTKGETSSINMNSNEPTATTTSANLCA